MAATQKAVSVVRVLAETLGLRTGLAVVSALDASANPTIMLGAGIAAGQNAFIRVKQDYDPALELNGIEATQRRYTPHVIQVVLEDTAVPTIPYLTAANWAKVLKELIETGMAIEIYEVADTNVPAVGGILAVNLTARIDSLFHPMTETI